MRPLVGLVVLQKFFKRCQNTFTISLLSPHGESNDLLFMKKYGFLHLIKEDLYQVLNWFSDPQEKVQNIKNVRQSNRAWRTGDLKVSLEFSA